MGNFGDAFWTVAGAITAVVICVLFIISIALVLLMGWWFILGRRLKKKAAESIDRMAERIIEKTAEQVNDRPIYKSSSMRKRAEAWSREVDR